MTAGDLIGQDRQAELDGVLMGDGTRFLIENWDLFGLPNLNSQDTDRNDIGVMAGVDRYAGRLLVIEGWLDAFPDLITSQADRATLESAFAPSNEDRELHFRLDDDRYCYVGRGRGIQTDTPSLQAWLFEARFLATDPRLYSGVLHSHTFDGTAEVLTNAGTRSTPWVWTVEGQCINPRLWLTDDPTSFTWQFPALELGPDDVLVVDSRTGMATVNGTSVIGQARDAGAVRLPFPFLFAAGDVSWSMDADGDEGFPVSTIRWRDAWA